jgi:outer membrane scaffolding protein for murein synthesis (MipA/OmpV family)
MKVLVGRVRRRTALAGIVIVFCVCLARTAFSQTPSPLQEWQYSRGWALLKLFELDEPERLILTGLAAERGPLYEGASSYRTRGGPVFEFRYRDVAFASVGEGVGVNVLRGRNYLAGVSLGYDLGRHVADDSVHLRGLDNISSALVMKLFGSYTISREFPLVLRFDMRKYVGGAAGMEGDLGAYLPLPGSSRSFLMFAGPAITWADRRHLDRSFGITLLEALKSGYPEYRPRAGVDAVGFGFSATRILGSRWMVNMDAAVDRLAGSARNSPLTSRGVEHIVTVSVVYRWQ